MEVMTGKFAEVGLLLYVQPRSSSPKRPRSCSPKRPLSSSPKGERRRRGKELRGDESEVNTEASSEIDEMGKRKRPLSGSPKGGE